MLSCFINVLLCIPMSYSLPGSSVHGTLQAGIWRGLPCPPLGNLPQPGIEPTYLMSSALAGRFFTTSTTWEAIYIYIYICASYGIRGLLRRHQRAGSCSSFSVSVSLPLSLTPPCENTARTWPSASLHQNPIMLTLWSLPSPRTMRNKR